LNKALNLGQIQNIICDIHINNHNLPTVILIAGCSRTGKTTLTNLLKSYLDKSSFNTEIVSLDNWLVDLDNRKAGDTVRERFNYKLIIKSIRDLIEGLEIKVPTYDSKTRKIVGKKSKLLIRNDCIVLVDGVVSLDITELRNLSDLNIFVDIDNHLRKERLLNFYSEYKKLDRNSSMKIIQERETEEVLTIKNNIKYADVVYNSADLYNPSSNK